MSKLLPAWYYQQFHADHTRSVPAERYGGWKKSELPFDPGATAFVVMHAWDSGNRRDFPGWWRAVEYIPRAAAIADTVFPPLLRALRNAGQQIIHVVAEERFAGIQDEYPGYGAALALEESQKDVLGTPGVAKESGEAPHSPAAEALLRFRKTHVFPGEGNQEDIKRGADSRFLPAAEPLPEEYIAATSRQLYAVCRAHGVEHLVYMGFAINWCLLMSPGGMLDMSRCGLICSAVRQGVTAVENRETAACETAKEIVLWRVAIAFVFV